MQQSVYARNYKSLMGAEVAKRPGMHSYGGTVGTRGCGCLGISALSCKTGIKPSYMYCLSSGKIDNPHKYVERLAVATGVSSHWPGIGDSCDPEPETTKEPLAHPTMLTHVTVEPPKGDWYEVAARVPDVLSPWIRNSTSITMFRKPSSALPASLCWW